MLEGTAPNLRATGAQFHPQARIGRATPSSYVVLIGTPEQVAAHLRAQGYADVRLCSEHELARLRHSGGALVVIYTSGSIVAQGARPQLAHDALAALVEAQP